MRRHLCWLLPLLALILFAPFSRHVDLAVSNYFFHGEEFTTNGFTAFLYKWGNLPGQILGSLSILLWGATYFVPRWKAWQKPAGAFALAFVLGPGLLVNGALKELWGRPRPREIVEFGGKHTFLPFYRPEFSEHGYGNKSFPSGHVSMGFLFLTIALIGRRERIPGVEYLGYYLAFQLGLLLALARIAVGGHFFSDCLVAAILMWWVALASCRIVYGPEEA